MPKSKTNALPYNKSPENISYEIYQSQTSNFKLKLLVERLMVQMLDVKATELAVKVSGKLVQEAFSDCKISDMKLFKSDDVAKYHRAATCLRLMIRR